MGSTRRSAGRPGDDRPGTGRLGTGRPGTDRPGTGRLGAVRAAVAGASVPARLASVLLTAEALVLLALGVLQVLRGFGSDIDDVGRAETGGVLALIGAAGIAVLAGGVLRRGAAFRSPTLVVQVLCLPVAWGLLQAGDYGYGVPLLVVPLLIVGSLLVAGGFGPSAPDARGPGERASGGRGTRGDDAEAGVPPTARRPRRP